MRQQKATYWKIYTYAPEFRYNNWLRRPWRVSHLRHRGFRRRGCRQLFSGSGQTYDTVVHELAHVLGFDDTKWEDQELLFNKSKNAPGADTYFYGLLARKAFNKVGGLRYRGGRKVPVENSRDVPSSSRDSHWRGSAFGNELMTAYSSGGNTPLSLVTIQAMADIGYVVDTTQADTYELPDNTAAAKALDGDPPEPFCKPLHIVPMVAP